jgi:hypothetical protein
MRDPPVFSLISSTTPRARVDPLGVRNSRRIEMLESMLQKG